MPWLLELNLLQYGPLNGHLGDHKEYEVKIWFAQIKRKYMFVNKSNILEYVEGKK